jgi:tRNA threonylcarbamoyladenosine biosynthesis protein TsaE
LDIITINEKAQLELGARLAKASHHRGCVIFLQGNLGAGKTTTVRGFLNALGYRDKVKSPTYTLVEEYEMPAQILYHVDLYRLQYAEEVCTLGLFEHTPSEKNKIIYLIEWAEKAETELPSPDITCNIIPFEKGRRCQVKGHTPCGKAIMQSMDR